MLKKLLIWTTPFAILTLAAPGGACPLGYFSYNPTLATLRYCTENGELNAAGSATGGACSVAGQISYLEGNLMVCDGAAKLVLSKVAGPTCESAGKLRFQSPNFQFCDGSNWQSLTPAVSYFVLTNGVSNGDLGGLPGANAFCLNDLKLQPWNGRASAILSAQAVKAFLCDGSVCGNLTPDASYLFAKAGDPLHGGATLKVDAKAVGPGDNANWSDSNHFNALTRAWFSRQASNATSWATSPGKSHCGRWLEASPGNKGGQGNLNATNVDRWAHAPEPCDQEAHLVCIVNAN